MFNGFFIDIGGKHLQFEMLFQRLHVLLQQYGDGVGFFTGGTAGDPDPDGITGALSIEQLRDGLGLKRRKRLRVTKKAGDVDQEIAKQRLHFGRIFLQEAHVFLQALDLVHRHAPLGPAVDGALLVAGEIVAGLRAQQDKNFLHLAFILGRRNRDRPHRLTESTMQMALSC